MKKILVVDDDTYICTLLENFLKEEGYKVETAFTARKGLEKVKNHELDLVLLDYRLPDDDGITVLKNIRKLNSTVPVIIITAYADVNSAVKLIKAGAYDYVTKPIRPEDLLSLIKQAMKRRSGAGGKKKFEEELVLGASPEMKEIMHMVRIVAPTSMSVLIEGETGTGKEYVSRAIHFNSKRKDQPFVAVDCGAIPYELANSELFGHVKGSFTGAIKDKTGSFETAHGGTLFLDEIGNLPYEVQVKLLRVLQERTINRVGENRDIRIDVRIIAASNQPLINMVKDNKFRDDLYHRLNEFKIEVPPLNQRPEDILVFAEHFREMSNEELDKSVKGFTDEAKHMLEQYIWLGNLRELKNVIKRSVLLCQSDNIDTSDLPDDLKADKRIKVKDTAKSKVSLKEASHLAERQVIMDALERANYNKSKAARLLKIDRKTLYNKLNLLGIDTNE